MRKKYEVSGYPAGVTESPAIVMVAESNADAAAKAAAMLRARGCNVQAEALVVSEYKPRTLERWP